MYRDEIRGLLNEADREFEKAAGLVEKRLLQIYRKALDNVKAEISKVFEGEDLPTITQARKYNRLITIEKNIISEIRTLNGFAIATTKTAINQALIDSYESTKSILKTTGIDFTFVPLNKAGIEYITEDNLWLDALKNRNAELLTNTKRVFETALRTNAREEVASGLIEGKSYASVAKAIEERFNISATRARTISFTEMHRGHSAGRVAGIKQARGAADELGIKVKAIWKHNNIGVARPSHLAMNGKPSDSNGLFHIDGFTTEGPGLFGEPSEDINCHCNAQIQVEGI
jgi:hypothetical protein